MVLIRNAERQAPTPPGERDDYASPADHPSSPDKHWVGAHPLADEHAVLLHEVRSRERAARVALGEGRWPEREVSGLVEYLRYEVLDQAVTEERVLFPVARHGVPDAQLQALVDEHVQLRDLSDQLADAVTMPQGSRQSGNLVELLDTLEDLLDRHMHAERALLTSTTQAGVESLSRPFRCHLWFPLTEGPEVDLDRLPREFAGRAALERFSRLRPGERLLVRSSRELDGLWHALSAGRPGEYGWAYLEEGPQRWRAEVICRTPE